MDISNTLIQGILLGGLYGLFAAGLSLMFGVMRLVNLAHGDFIVLSAYLALVTVATLGIHPLWTLGIVVPAMAALGYAGQRIMMNRVVTAGLLPPVMVTFGLSIIIQNMLLEVFKPDSRRLSVGALDTASLQIPGGVSIGTVSLIMFLTAVAVLAGLGVFFRHTITGRLLRAVSDDPEIVGLMGANRKHLYAVATAIAAAVVAIAGVLMSVKTNFDPLSGPTRLLFAFEAVIIGGMGNLWGTLLGGVILGLAQAIGARIDPGIQILAGHLTFLAILAFRPEGILGSNRS